MPIRSALLLVALVFTASACGTQNRPSSLVTTTDANSMDLPTVVASDIPPVPVDTADVPGMDAGMAMDAGQSAVDVVLNEAGYPEGPYGSSVGAIFLPFQLPTCAGVSYAFDGTGFAANRFTVVSLVSLYCTACESDATNFQTTLNDGFSSLGVRILQVLTDGTSAGSQATAAECTTWTNLYGLTFPVLTDPLGTIRATYSNHGAYPVIYIVDSHGVIRWVSFESTDGAESTAEELDILLAAH